MLSIQQDDELNERQSEIAELIRQEGYVSVNHLADRLNVTSQTIRRDLQVLVANGLARRRHGGVEPLDRGTNLPYGARQVLSVEAKRRTAEVVTEHIHDGESVALGIGTTPAIVAEVLAVHRAQLRIITGSINAAVAASANPTFSVNVIGGRMRPVDLDIVGPEAVEQLDEWDIDVSIVGVAGISASGGLLDFWEEEATLRRALTERADRTYLVLDGTKFGRRAHVKAGMVSDVDAIFTDALPPPEVLRQAQESGIKVHVS